MLALLVITACSKDDGIMRPSESAGPEQKGLEAARQRLAKIAANPLFRKQLTSEENPMGLAIIKDLSMYDRCGAPLTRADEDSAMFYVFEFENGGFAVLGEAPHMPELIACDFGPVVDSLNFDPWIIGGDHSGDPIVFGDTTKNYNYEAATYSYLNGVEPLRFLWHQEAPFNEYCPGKYAGCLPLAVAMTMTHPSGRPYSYDGLVFDWEEMFKYENNNYHGPLFSFTGEEHVGRLIEMLGRQQNLKAIYDAQGTKAPMSNVPRTFRNFGYTNGGTVSDYSFETVKAEIASNHPVIAGGKPDKNANVGHAWVISSILVEEIPWTICDAQTGLVVSSGVDTFYLVHCNWGFQYTNDIIRNGFYIKDCFDPSKGPRRDDDGNFVTYNNNPLYGNYRYDVQIVHNIRK